MNPMNICTTALPLAAFASSEADGRERWTELRVFYHPFAAKCWLAEARGRSAIDGEVDKVRRLDSASLERALRLFDDTDLGVIVKEGAREYAEANDLPAAPKGATASSDRQALDMLFGEEMSTRAIGRALGTDESKLRAALKDGRPLNVPLLALFPYIDRAALKRAHRAGEMARG